MIRQFSAGGAVFKKEDRQILWLLIKPKPSKEFPSNSSWRLPKGLLEEGEKSIEAAVREVEEETGVKAKIIQKIETGSWFFVLNKERIFKTATYFLMEAIEENNRHDQLEVEEVAWFPANQALEKITLKRERQILRKAQDFLRVLDWQLNLFSDGECGEVAKLPNS